MHLYHFAIALGLEALTVCTLAIDTSSTSLFNQYHNLSLNTTRPVNTTDKYYVECLGITNPRQPKLSATSCDVHTICRKLSFPQPRLTSRGQWKWTTVPGCSLGYYIPQDAPAALIPLSQECENGIFGRIIGQCGTDQRYNSGSINVDYPPTPLMPGFPVTVGYPRYIMAPSELDTGTSA